MKIFKDSKCLNEATEKISFGRIKAGEKARTTLYLQNDSKGLVEIVELKLSHPELKVVEKVDTIGVNKVGKFVIEWSPSLTLKEGLKTSFEIIYDEIYSPAE